MTGRRAIFALTIFALPIFPGLCAPALAQERVRLEWKVGPKEDANFTLQTTPYTGSKPLAKELEPGLLSALAYRRAAGKPDGKLSPALAEALNPPAAEPGVGQSVEVKISRWTEDRLRCTLASSAGERKYVLGRLVLNRSGQNKSFWVPFQVQNMIIPVVELAPNPVRVGDRWPVHVNLLQQRQPLTVESSHRANQVSLVSFDAKSGEATLEYLISEEVVGAKSYPDDTAFGLAFHLVGRGVFSTREGNWSRLDLRMVLVQGGRAQEAVIRVRPLAK